SPLPFFYNGTPPTHISTLSLHDALPISAAPIASDADHAQFSGVNAGFHDAECCKHQADMTTNDVIHGRSRATVRNMVEARACHRLKHFHIEMAGGTDPE